MKKRILALTAALAFSAGTAIAIPYASQIRATNTSPALGSSTTISYILNMEADSVEIEIVDAADAVVASFSGPTAWGHNSVVWDLTDDNDGGNPVTPEEDYRIRVNVDADNPEEWNWFAINQSPDHLDDYWNEPPLDEINHKNLFNRVRGHSVNIPWDQDSDTFGLVLLTSSHSAGTADPGHGKVVKVTTDLRPPLDSVDGGRDTAVLRHPNSDDPDSHTFQDTWYMTEDPLNPEYYYVAGQATSGIRVYYGHINDHTGVQVLGDGPATRTVAARADGDDRILYFSHGNNTIDRAVVDANNEITEDDLVNILDIGENLYSKHVMLDADGNLYWLSRVGWVYRWPASLVETATEEGDLTDANADWVVDATGIDSRDGVELYELAETPDGDIIVSTQEGLVNLGNRSQASVNVAIDGTDAFFAFPPELPLDTSFASGIYSDAFGNIYFTKGATGTDLGYAAASPGGQSSTSVTAPLSQTLNVNPEPTDARMWHLYE